MSEAMISPQAMAGSGARIIIQAADMDAAIRIAKKIAAGADNTATMCVAAILILSAVLDSPAVPPGGEEMWFETVLAMLRSSMLASHEMGQRKRPRAAKKAK